MRRRGSPWVAVGRGGADLVNLLPAVLVLGADARTVRQQQLTAARVAAHHGRVVQRRQPTPVLVVRGAAQVQQGLRGATAHRTHREPRPIGSPDP